MFKTLIATAVLAAAVATTAIAAPAISGATPANGQVSGPIQDDNEFGSDMSVVHELLARSQQDQAHRDQLAERHSHRDGIGRSAVAKEIKDHVARMNQRLKDGKVFNVASRTLPTIFANNAKIHTEIQQTPNGVILTQTSNDPATVAALQAHAGEVSDLAREGMVALQRSVMANGGPMGSDGPMMHGSTAQGQMGPGMMGHRGHDERRWPDDDGADAPDDDAGRRPDGAHAGARSAYDAGARSPRRVAGASKALTPDDALVALQSLYGEILAAPARFEPLANVIGKEGS